MKNCCIVFTEPLSDAFFQEDGLDAGLSQGAFEFFQLVCNVDLLLVQNVCKAETLLEDRRRTDCNSRVGDNTRKRILAGVFSCLLNVRDGLLRRGECFTDSLAFFLVQTD